MNEIERRREARRLKILQNATNRLEKITGIEQKAFQPPPIPQIAPDLPENHSYNEPPSIPTISIASQQPEIRTTPKSNDKLVKALVIIGLACFVNIQLGFLSNYISESNLNKIFVPFLIYEVFNVIGPKRPGETPNKTNFLQLLLISKLQNPKLVYLFKYMEYASIIIQDAMVFFFGFVCCEMLKKAAIIGR